MGGPSDIADELTGADIAHEVVRSDLVERTLKSLLEDAERCEGELARAEINRVYLKRKLTVAECGAVEKQLLESSITILEEEDGADEEKQVGQNSSIRLPSRKYLSPEEEVQMGRKILFEKKVLEAGGEIGPDFRAQVVREADRARTAFMQTNSHYVWKLAGLHSRGTHLKREDLYQEGMIGILRATETWNPDLGFRFKTYASWWIQQTMHRARANGERTVRLPVHVLEKVAKLKRTEVKISRELGRPPTIEEVANYLGAPAHNVAKLMWRVQLTQTVEADAPTGDNATVLSFKADEEGKSAFEYLAQRELRALLQAAMMQLSPREERVIRMRFGFDGDIEHTLESVGMEFSVTRERIRQIESKALRKLRHPKRSRVLTHFVEA